MNRRSRFASPSRPSLGRWALACLLLLAGVIALGAGAELFFGISPRAAAARQQRGDDSISQSAWQQIQALLEEKESRTPEQRKIDSQLLYAIKARRGDQSIAAVPALRAEMAAPAEGKAVVDITGRLGGLLLEKLEAAGAEIMDVVPGYNSIRASVPLEQLERIASFPEVIFIQPKQEAATAGGARRAHHGEKFSPTHPPAPGFAERAARVRSYLSGTLPQPAAARGAAPLLVGSIDSEGDVTHKAALARSTLGVNGTGVKIGVLSDGVTSLALSQASGDLGPVTVLPGQTGAGDEGTAMLEIIHDLAPGAELFFATAVTSLTRFAQNIRDLRAAGCEIIVDDILYFAETPFQDGQAPGVVSPTNGGLVIEAVNEVTAAGALFFSAAFNEGNLNDGTSGCWEGDFADGGTLALLPGGKVHDFGGGAQSDLITASSGPVFLFWSDPLGGSANDYDLFILNNAGTAVVASSTNIQNGTQDPFEIVGAQPAGQRVVILQKAGAANRFLHLTAFRGRLGIGTDGQTHGHSSAAEAFSVAATPAADFLLPPNPVGPFPGFFNSSNVVELFSSDGPRRLFFNADGSALTPGNFSSTGGLVRQKPDITAADGVSVTGAGTFSSIFFGTSASAPHAAAIAGLLKAANPAFTNAQIRTALTSTAIDIEAPGVDRDSGHGIVMALEALLSLGVAPQASVDLGTVTAMEDGGNGDGFIDPGEGGKLTVELKNSGVVAATEINATLTSSTPGVTITQGTSAYPDLPASGGAGVNATPFTFTLAADAPCDLAILFNLTITYNGGPSPKVFNFTVQAGHPPVAINSTLDAAPPPSGPNFVGVTGLQSPRLTRDGLLSTCGAPKAFPGLFGAGQYRFDAYIFTACPATPSQCVTVTLTNNSANVTLFSTAYLGAFDPNNLAANYLGDAGLSSAVGDPLSYSLNVPGGAPFIVVVHEVNPGGGIGNNYELKVSGACAQCPPPAAPADLSVFIEPILGTVRVGDLLTYRVLVSNHGPSPAIGVMLSETLPPEVALVSAASVGSCGGYPTLTCNLGSLSPGVTTPVLIAVRPLVAGLTTNTARVAPGPGITFDPNPDNNSFTRYVKVEK